jgi:hypothetical protein
VARYEARSVRAFPGDVETVRALAERVLGALGGKVRSASDGTALAANFNKKVGKRYLQNRIDVELRVEPDPDAPGTALVHGLARPVDPLGRPLAFGVLGDPGAVVLGDVLDAIEGAAGAG